MIAKYNKAIFLHRYASYGLSDMTEVRASLVVEGTTIELRRVS
jgi:hypothetical protein